MFTRKSISVSLMSAASLFSTLACGWLIYSWGLTHNSLRTTGVVVSLTERSSSSGDTMFCPAFKFRDASNLEYIVQSSVGSSPPRFPKGASVPVLYRPNNPSDAQIEDKLTLWFVPAILLVISLFGGSVGLIIHRRPSSTSKGLKFGLKAADPLIAFDTRAVIA
jgi:hypothetical protein